MMDAPAGSNEAISFHSAIPMSGMHSRRAVAYDLAIGQACSIDDEVFYAYLCRVADWRLGWKKNYRDGRNGIAPNSSDVDLPNEALVALYRAENEVNRHLIDATDLYRSNREPNYDRAGSAASSGGGFLPGCALSASIPTLVESETIGDRQRSVHLAPGVSGAYR